MVRLYLRAREEGRVQSGATFPHLGRLRQLEVQGRVLESRKLGENSTR